MAEAVHKPGQAGEKMEDNREWMSLEILRIILERRLSAPESTNSNEPVFGSRPALHREMKVSPTLLWFHPN